jgi:pyruvate formate lyase activating enzyme
MTVEEVMAEILADKLFYELSGGGVTLSGGEPALSRDFARDILRQCKEHGLHTAVETCGEAPWDALEELLPFTDLVMMDLKLVDEAKHRAATRQSNGRILENARRLAASSTPVIFRTPIVPSVNDSVEDISAIANFVRELKEQRSRNGGANGATAAVTYEIMPFHRLAAGKYASLGREYPAAAIDPPARSKMAELAEAARRQGIATLDHGNAMRL